MSCPFALGPALRLLREGMDRTVLRSGVAAIVLVALGGAATAGSPLALKHLIDAIVSTHPQHLAGEHPVLWYGTIYLLLLTAGRLAADVRPLLTGRIEQHVLTTLRQRFFAHLMHLPMTYLVKRRNGELMHSIDLAAAGAQAAISQVTNGITPVLVELVLMAAILSRLQQPELVVVFFTTCLLYLACFAVGVARQQSAIQAVMAASLDVHSRLSEGISHVETLRYFGAEPQAEKSLASASSQLAGRWLGFNRLTMQSGLMASTIFASAQTACLAIAAHAVAEGRITVGGFVLASVYTLQMVRPLEMLGVATRDLARAAGFMQPLLDILAEPAEVTPRVPEPSPASRRSPASAPSIRLEGLRFGYDPHQPVIRDLDLDIAAGRRTAIVGRSGSGKSSLARLLLRLYAPQAGRILVGGRSIETLPDAELRALIGVVPQDAGLLQATVSDNITLGLPDATQQEIELAARHAQIHELVGTLPRGYDTLLGERGQTLSGGERQRLAMARAMLRQPRIYVLDEPTSMLDSKTEADMLRALREVTAGCTTLVIAHRLSTIMDADEIVVLEGGQVHERGRHSELLAKDGLYAQLWRQQTVGEP